MACVCLEYQALSLFDCPFTVFETVPIAIVGRSRNLDVLARGRWELAAA